MVVALAFVAFGVPLYLVDKIGCMHSIDCATLEARVQPTLSQIHVHHRGRLKVRLSPLHGEFLYLE